MVKSVALYGTFTKKVPMKQRYWKWVYHRKGSKAGQRWYKKRFWVYPKGRTKTVVLKGRFEFYGHGRSLFKAIKIALNYVPKSKKVVVSAQDFLDYPLEYGDFGTWIDYDVES